MNVIVDTSVWIDHLRKPVDSLVLLLNNSNVLVHSWVLAELSLGHLRSREKFLGNMKLMPHAPEVSIAELLEFISDRSLRGRGLGLVDVQILASALLSHAAILTRDRALLGAMKDLKIAGF